MNTAATATTRSTCAGTARPWQDRGITEILFTADGGTDYFLDGGALPDTWATATLGSRGEEADEVWERRRPGEPFFTVEFWNGWFDHWGENHHTRSGAEAAAEAKKILDVGGSICLYMAHGGTQLRVGFRRQPRRRHPAHRNQLRLRCTHRRGRAPDGEVPCHAGSLLCRRGPRIDAGAPNTWNSPGPVVPAPHVRLDSAELPCWTFVRAARPVASVKPLVL